jgi:hypothetical protein
LVKLQIHDQLMANRKLAVKLYKIYILVRQLFYLKLHLLGILYWEDCWIWSAGSNEKNIQTQSYNHLLQLNGSPWDKSKEKPTHIFNQLPRITDYWIIILFLPISTLKKSI